MSGALLACSLGGCATVRPDGPLDRNSLDAVLRDRGVDPTRVVLPYEITDEMRRWAHERVPEGAAPGVRLDYLSQALLDPDAMRVEYSWGHTGTAREVFESRRANCLAFTNLFLGMARELGLEAYYLSVETVENYRRQGDLVVVSDHIAVGWGETTGRRVYDFSERPLESAQWTRKVADLEAIAMFHSNRGAEALQEGRLVEAERWLDVAVQIDDGLVPAWVNYGVVLRRLDRLAEAEDAYLRALAIDPRRTSAYHNLASLLRSLDRIEEAKGYEEALARDPGRNPFTFLRLGDLSRAAGRTDDAERFYRRARSLAAQDPEPLAALGQWSLSLGDTREARRFLRKAEALGPSARGAALRRAIERR